jgi:hypothetical protein
MQHTFTTSAIKSEKKVLVTKARLLSLYFEPPQIELTLDEFEMLSLDRLQLLRGMEVLKGKNYDEYDFIQKLNEVNKFKIDVFFLNNSRFRWRSVFY